MPCITFKSMIFCLFILNNTCFNSNCFSRSNNNWFLGDWFGHLYSPNSCFTDIKLRMRIENIEGISFTGICVAAISDDTTVRIVTAIVGKIYKDHMTFTVTGIREVTQPPRCRWITDCGPCKTGTLNFAVSDNKFVISSKVTCDYQPVCTGTTYYSRELEDFEEGDRTSLEKMIDQSGDATLKSEYSKHRLPTLKKTIPEIPGTSISLKPPNDNKNNLTFFTPLQEYSKKTVDLSKSIMVDADSVEITVYDNGVVDNDTISLIYNGTIVISHLRLNAKGYIVKLKVDQRFTNQIILVAENTGSIFPNTCFLKIVFGTKREEFFSSSDLSKYSSLLLFCQLRKN